MHTCPGCKCRGEEVRSRSGRTYNNTFRLCFTPLNAEAQGDGVAVTARGGMGMGVNVGVIVAVGVGPNDVQPL